MAKFIHDSVYDGGLQVIIDAVNSLDDNCKLLLVDTDAGGIIALGGDYSTLAAYNAVSIGYICEIDLKINDCGAAVVDGVPNGRAVQVAELTGTARSTFPGTEPSSINVEVMIVDTVAQRILSSTLESSNQLITPNAPINTLSFQVRFPDAT